MSKMTIRVCDGGCGLAVDAAVDEAADTQKLEAKIHEFEITVTGHNGATSSVMWRGDLCASCAHRVLNRARNAMPTAPKVDLASVMSPPTAPAEPKLPLHGDTPPPPADSDGITKSAAPTS